MSSLQIINSKAIFMLKATKQTKIYSRQSSKSLYGAGTYWPGLKTPVLLPAGKYYFRSKIRKIHLIFTSTEKRA